MSSQTHRIELQARDGTKQAFDSIKRSAEQDARALEQMGKTGSKALGDVEKSAKDTERSVADLDKRMAALGAVITGGAALLGEWSRNSQDAAAIQRQLEASIAATGEEYATYADRIAAAGARAVQLGQDDEAASQAISALTQITGSASIALDNMGLVMDLAAAKSMSLESAAELVGKVHEGNTAILARYGIVVQEGATAEQALAQIQSQVAGQAEAHATTYARLREEISNVTDKIGGMVSGAVPLLTLMPGISSGLTLVGSAAGALAPNLTKSAVASKALSLAMGPAGLVLATGAATFAVIKLLDAMGTSYVEAAEDAERATANLAETIARLGEAGSPRTTLGEAWKRSFEEAIAPLLVIEEQLIKIKNDRESIFTQPVADQASADARQVILDQMAKEEDRLSALADQYGGTTEIVREYGETQEALAKILAASGPGADRVLEIHQGFKDAYDAGRISLAQYMNLTQFLAETLGVYDEAAIRAAGATDRVGESVEKTAAITDRAIGRWQEYDVAVKQARQADIDKTKANKELLDSMSVQANAEADQLERNQQKWDEYDAAVRAANDSRVQSTKAAQDYLDALAEEQDIVAENADVANELAGETIEFGNATAHATGEIREQTATMDGWEGQVRTGIRALNDFKVIQDDLIAQQDVYNQQYSEYGSQITAIERAVTILQERQAEGIALSKEEQELLDTHVANLERLEGGQEDAAVAAGILANRYGENVSNGDELNRVLAETTGATEDLAASIDRLTIALVLLDGTNATPEVSISGLGTAQEGLAAVIARMNALDGATANATVNVGANIDPGLGGLADLFATGGMVGAATGRMTGDWQRIRVNEGFGMSESATLPTGTDVMLPGGSIVWPHAATTERAKRQGGGDIHITGPVHIHTSSPQDFYRQLQSAHLGSARR